LLNLTSKPLHLDCAIGSWVKLEYPAHSVPSAISICSDYLISAPAASIAFSGLEEHRFLALGQHDVHDDQLEIPRKRRAPSAPVCAAENIIHHQQVWLQCD
jgi:hypothetical protein